MQQNPVVLLCLLIGHQPWRKQPFKVATFQTWTKILLSCILSDTCASSSGKMGKSCTSCWRHMQSALVIVKYVDSIYVCTYMYTFIYIYICIYTYYTWFVFLSIYIMICIYMYTYGSLCICKYMYIYFYIYIYMYLYM